MHKPQPKKPFNPAKLSRPLKKLYLAGMKLGMVHRQLGLPKMGLRLSRTGRLNLLPMAGQGLPADSAPATSTSEPETMSNQAEDSPGVWEQPPEVAE